MVDVLDASGARKPKPGLAAIPTSTISAAQQAAPYTELARAVGAVGEALTEATAPYQAAQGAKAVTRDADGNIQVQWRGEFTSGDRLYNAAARQAGLAMGKTETEQGLLELRNQYDGRPAEFQKAAKDYIANVGKNGDPLLRPFLRNEAERSAGQYFEGLISAKHDLDLKNAFSSLVDRRKLVADNLEALAAQGGVGTEEYQRAQAEWKDIGQQLAANGKFPYTADKDAFDTQRLESRLTGESAAAMTRRLLTEQGVEPARKFVQDFFNDEKLGMDARERRTYRNLAESVINERSKELATARREVTAEGKDLLTGIKNGVAIDDASFDDFLQRASAAGAAPTVRALVSARAAKEQWKMFESLPTTERANFARQAITGGPGGPGMSRLVGAVMQQESTFDPNAESHKGASGLMQVMPGTAREVATGLGIRALDGKSDDEVKAILKSDTDLNVQLGTAYLSQNLRKFGGDVPAALVAYNAGPGVAQEWIASGKNDAVLPIETRNYKEKILANLNMGAPPSGPVLFNGRQLSGSTSAEQVGSMYIGMNERDPAGRKALSSFIEKYAGSKIDPATVPWCAAFVNAVMGASGRKGTGSLRALDFLNYGTPTDAPGAGDIVVFNWGDGSGHAGIVQGFEEKDGKRYIRVLGGNQGGTDDAGNRVKGSVSSSLFKLDDVAGYRKPPPPGGGPEFAQPRRFNTADGGRAFLYPDASMIDDYRKAMGQDARRLAPSIADGFKKGLPPSEQEFTAFIDMVTLSGDQKLRTETMSLVKSLEASKQFEGLPKPVRDAAMQRLAQELSGGSSEIQRAMLDNLTESFDARDKALADDPMSAGPRYGMVAKQAPLDWNNLDAALPARAKASNELRSATGSVDPVLPLTKAEVGQLAQQFSQGDGATASKLLGGLVQLPPDQFGAIMSQAPVKDALIGMSRSGDPQKMTAAFSALDAEHKRDPAAFTKAFGASVENKLELWNAKMAYMPAETLAKEMLRSDDPSTQKAREAMRAEGVKKVEKVTASDIAGYFDESVMPFTAPSAPAQPLQAGELKVDFEREFSEVYAEIGDEGKARQIAVDRLKKVWAPSIANGGRLMKFAPEKSAAYPPIGGSHDWIAKQLDNDVRTTLYGMGALIPDITGRDASQNIASPEATAMLGAPRMIVPDARTEAEFNAGKPPSYPIVVMAPNGMYVALQNAQGQQARFTANPDIALTAGRDAALATFGGMEEARASQERYEADIRRRAEQRRTRSR
ncbi:transglycosylase SLT domain-containing protein [Bosea sp. BK604]|uniref:transglycosylase SLT domain-containing protein n=1 Tax=Bosea sp. BK604 TaxID=2512180 RepID=UPI001042F898|nr:transglycosylase SLT domain-containing protein [Bosea sp. BK604]TCR64697.1 uncharacterized protein (TIGR02594 family) [Bosea sp. BK604]